MNPDPGGQLITVTTDPSDPELCSYVPGGPPEGGASCAGIDLLSPQLSGHDVTVSLVDDEEQNQVRAFFSYQEFYFFSS
jgi:hypothetical protein